jgi:hypothetical protein
MMWTTLDHAHGCAAAASPAAITIAWVREAAAPQAPQCRLNSDPQLDSAGRFLHGRHL